MAQELFQVHRLQFGFEHEKLQGIRQAALLCRVSLNGLKVEIRRIYNTFFI
jgi:hypothetical protein